LVSNKIHNDIYIYELLLLCVCVADEAYCLQQVCKLYVLENKIKVVHK